MRLVASIFNQSIYRIKLYTIIIMARHSGGSIPRNNLEESSQSRINSILSKIANLSQEDKQKLYSDVYEHGDFSEVHPDPNASDLYNDVAFAIQRLSEEEKEVLLEQSSSTLQGGRRKINRRRRRATRKATRHSKKTRRVSHRK
jgi:ribosome recycling factor